MGLRRYFQRAIDYSEHHHVVPEVVDEQRHRGIILTLVAWFLIAFYTVMFQSTNHVIEEQPSLGSAFMQMLVLEFTAMLVLFPLCLSRGWAFFRCRRPALIFIRGLCAAAGIFMYSFARAWTPVVDNSILYTTDVIWILLFLMFMGIKIPKLSVVGVLIGMVGMLVVWWFDVPTWRDAIGGGWGLLSGVTLAIITLLAPYMIKQDSPLKIAFYQALIGTVFFAVICLFYGFHLPPGHQLFAMVIAGIMFASAIVCFLEAFFYTESYVIGAISLLFPLFVEAISWVFFRQPVPLSTLLGAGIVTVGCLLVIGDSLKQSRRHIHRYSDSGIKVDTESEISSRSDANADHKDK